MLVFTQRHTKEGIRVACCFWISNLCTPVAHGINYGLTLLSINFKYYTDKVEEQLARFMPLSVCFGELSISKFLAKFKQIERSQLQHVYFILIICLFYRNRVRIASALCSLWSCYNTDTTFQLKIPSWYESRRSILFQSRVADCLRPVYLRPQCFLASITYS